MNKTKKNINKTSCEAILCLTQSGMGIPENLCKSKDDMLPGSTAPWISYYLEGEGFIIKDSSLKMFKPLIGKNFKNLGRKVKVTFEIIE